MEPLIDARTIEQAQRYALRFGLWWRNGSRWWQRYLIRAIVMGMFIVPAWKDTFGQIVTHRWYHWALDSDNQRFHYPCRSLLDGDIQFKYVYYQLYTNSLVWSDWTQDGQGEFTYDVKCGEKPEIP